MRATRRGGQHVLCLAQVEYCRYEWGGAVFETAGEDVMHPESPFPEGHDKGTCSSVCDGLLDGHGDEEGRGENVVVFSLPGGRETVRRRRGS